MSYYSELMKRQREAAVIRQVKPPNDPTHLCDFSETNAYHFVVKEKGKTLAEGSLTRIKLALDESYLRKKIKAVHRNKETMITILEY